MIGVGGIGMSGLARLFLHEKKGVSGSDRTMSAITQALEEEGVVFFSDQGAHNITDDIDLVVYSEALSKDHPEMVAARERDIPMLNYFGALGMVANEYYLIAIAGTHGKTTTTAMTIDVLEAAGLDPTAIVGSLRSKTKSNFRAGKSKYFVAEACEYRRDFLSLTPDILAITSIEADHLDYYKDEADFVSAFAEFVAKVNEDGKVIANPGSENVKTALARAREDITVVDYTKHLDPLLKLKVPGTHNFQNAAIALAIAAELGIEKDVVKEALEDFSGTWRRFEYKGKTKEGALVYDDYAHHPSEITATITSVRELFPDKKLTVVFQPHMFSRTAELFDGFVESLSKADRVILADVYDARAVDAKGVDSKTLTDAISQNHPDATYVGHWSAVPDFLIGQGLTSQSEVVVVMGAGDIASLPEKLVK